MYTTHTHKKHLTFINIQFYIKKNIIFISLSMKTEKKTCSCADEIRSFLRVCVCVLKSFIVELSWSSFIN